MASMTPDFFSKLLFWRKERADKSQQSNGLTKWEYAVNELRKIIIWENPVKSFACLVGVNVIFWLLINIKLKFYGLIFVALLVATVNQLWNDQFQRSMTTVDTDSGRDSATPGSSSTSHSRFSPGAEMNSGFEMLRSACIRLKRLRQEQPGTFCLGTCISFLMLSFIGRTISGVTLLYTLLTAVMIVPGIVIHLVPSHIFNSLIQYIYSSHKEGESDKEEEDYMPETNQETLELLRLASDLHTSRRDGDASSRDLLLEEITGRTNDKTESCESKLLFFPETSMPGVEDSNLDFPEFEITGVKHSKSRKSDDGSDSEGDINFQSKHFNGDSSDEEEFASGLKFKDVVGKDDKLESDSFPGLLNAASVGLNLLTTGANILSSAVKSPSSPSSAVPEIKRHDRESSSDTDSFELISEEDI